MDEEGSSHLTLTKKYKDEQINIEIMCNEQVRSSPVAQCIRCQYGVPKANCLRKMYTQNTSHSPALSLQPEEPAYEDEEGNPVDPEDDDLSLGRSLLSLLGAVVLLLECGTLQLNQTGGVTGYCNAGVEYSVHVTKGDQTLV